METPLERARRHVAEGERLIAEQQARIIDLRADGHPTGQAEEFLTALLRTLAAMQEHLATEEETAGRSLPRTESAGRS
jgi:hypothetical protein